MHLNFADYTPDPTCHWLWTYSAKPNELTCLYAPVLNMRRWTVIRFEIRMQFDTVLKRTLKIYAQKEKMELSEPPFEWKPMVVEKDSSAEWLEYIATGKASEDVAKVLPTLGSYAGREAA